MLLVLLKMLTGFDDGEKNGVGDYDVVYFYYQADPDMIMTSLAEEAINTEEAVRFYLELYLIVFLVTLLFLACEFLQQTFEHYLN